MKFFQNKKYTFLSKIAKYGFVFVFGLMLLSSFTYANTNNPPGGNSVGNNPPGGNSVGTNITIEIENPLGNNIDTIPKFIEALIEIVLIIGVPIVVLALIYVGFLFVKAQGNAEELTKAKKALLYTLIGAALLLGAFVIANAIGKTVDEIKSAT
jgi:hypothetical protein